jgi:molecular chaperone HtpG
MSLSGTAKINGPSSAVNERAAERHELPEVIIGKDILELVSSAMYVDPMTVYREYVQNAADAVDAARAEGVLAAEDPGRIDIFVDPSVRTIRIRDNGCGIPFRSFGRKMTALGGSAKRGTRARGFRGVGRLAGLGYAQELVFRSRVEGEARVSELRWDCRQLRAALREVGDGLGVADLIRSVTTLERVDIEGAPQHFFEVEMKGIIRLRNDRLMSPSAISEYLSQVAPVPFSPDFRLGTEITEALKHYVDLGELDIRVEGAEEPIFRPHRNSFSFEDKQSITFDSLSVVELPGIDGEVAAVAWVLHHDYEGTVPTGTLVKGLRLRSGNVQVGDHALLEDLFPEPRFNAWSVGEVHVLDRRIVPNGRRDHFEQNAHFHNLTNHLTPTARDIARRCRTNSIRRKWVREFELHMRTVEETQGIIEQGSISRSEREELALSAEKTLMQMTKVAGMELLADGLAERTQITDGLRVRLGKLMNDDTAVSSPLMRLPEAQRKMYEHFFGLVYDCSANRVAAKALIDRILMRLS